MRYYRNTAGHVVVWPSTGKPPDGWTFVMPEAVAELIAHPITLEDAKAAKHNEIKTAFEAAAASLLADYPEPERWSWTTQMNESTAWHADPSVPTPYLDAMAQARGISADEMRQKAYEQTQTFLGASPGPIGLRQKLRDAIDAATTVEQVTAIAWPS